MHCSLPFQEKKFGAAGCTVVVEEKLEGEEVSVSIAILPYSNSIDMSLNSCCKFMILGF